MKYFTPALFIFLQITSAYATDNYDDTTCDNVCTQLVDATNAKEMGITGTDSWTSSDDAWCAANPYSSTNPPTSSTLATQQNRCQYHSTQVLTYCIAYEKIHSAQGMETPLLVLDIAGAALCGTACFTEIGGAPLVAACRIDSTAASAMDVYDSMVLQSDSTARALTGVMGAAGLLVAGSELVQQADAGVNVMSSANAKQFLSGHAGSKKNACFAAAVLAAGAGMRAWDLAHQQQSKESACNDVKNLLSNSPIIGVINTTTPSTAQAGSSSSISKTNGQARSGTSVTGSGAGNLAAQVACAQNGLTTCNFANQGQLSAATDGGLLSSSGLDKSAAQQLAKSDLSGVSQTAPNASAMLASALGPDAGDVGTKLAEVAAAAQKDGQKLAKATGTYEGGASAVAQAQKNPAFGGFNFDSPAAADKKDEVKFDRVPASASGDIWHADFKGSIFQIVSSKIVESKPLIDHLDWTTPLNRALMGLPAKKATEGLK